MLCKFRDALWAGSSFASGLGMPRPVAKLKKLLVVLAIPLHEGLVNQPCIRRTEG